MTGNKKSGPPHSNETATECSVAESRENLLATKVETLNHLLVALFRLTPSVVEELTALGNHLEKTTAGRNVFLVSTEVLSEVQNTHAQEGYLIVRTTGVSWMDLEVRGIDGAFAHVFV